jgi:hypothetical protein
MPDARTDLYGHVVPLAEPDYAFGAGLLLLRVSWVADTINLANNIQWVEVHGTQVHPLPSGDRDGQQRTVWVRLAALRKIPLRG